MSLPNVFSKDVATVLVNRIEKLKPDSTPLWGKMNAAQMLAHCSVAYEMTYEEIHKKPNAFLKLILKLVVKNGVVNEKPYPKNAPTAPQFKILSDKNFADEKRRLINYILKTQTLGESFFDNKINSSFGKLSSTEWNNLFYKHLDHHLQQFGL